MVLLVSLSPRLLSICLACPVAHRPEVRRLGVFFVSHSNGDNEFCLTYPKFICGKASIPVLDDPDRISSAICNHGMAFVVVFQLTAPLATATQNNRVFNYNSHATVDSAAKHTQTNPENMPQSDSASTTTVPSAATRSSSTGTSCRLLLSFPPRLLPFHPSRNRAPPRPSSSIRNATAAAATFPPWRP